MKKYKCVICGKISEQENKEKCLYCGADSNLLEEVHDEDSIKYKRVDGRIPIAEDNPSIARIDEKCINCGLCSKICQDKVGIKYSEDSTNPICINCGQCLLNCPVGAIVPKYCYKKVLDYIKDTSKTVICYTSPAIRVSLGDEFNLEPGVNIEKKIVSSLRKLGFNYVFDTTFGADLTIMEEASELVEKIKSGKKGPLFTSCCPAWVKYLEIYYKELIGNLSSCKSPISMQGKMIKTYFSEMKSINSDDIITVAIAPCTAKKAEIKREEIDGTDFVLTTTELALMLREEEININNLEDEEFDHLMNLGSGAGVIFGASGGVTEAALRYAYFLITKKEPPKKLLEFSEVRGNKGIKEAEITIENINLKILVCHGLTNISKIIESGDYQKYDFIEVMNCMGGCIGGGGQPLKVVSKFEEIVLSRMKSLYEEDKNMDIKTCYQNQDIIDIYKSYLDKPLSDKAKELLHTKYTDKSSILRE